MHDFSNVQLHKHVLMHILHAKASLLWLTTTFGFTGWYPTLVERIPYIFAEINPLTSFNTANIDIVVGTLAEGISCMISAELHQGYIQV